MVIEFDETKQNKRLNDLRKDEEEELVQLLSTKYGHGYINLSVYPVSTDALKLIPEPKAREAKIAAYNLIGKRVDVAVLSPNNPLALEIIKNLDLSGYTTTLHMTSTASLERAWSKYTEISFAVQAKAGALDISDDEVSVMVTKIHAIDDVEKLVREVMVEKKAYRTSRIIEIIMAGAFATKSSDVHLEPEEGNVRMRYRLDGVLHEILSFDHETYESVLSRIKLLSGMKLNIKEEAQDGRFSIKINEDHIEIRVSIIPGNNGESIVMRLLNPKSIQVSLESMGIPKKLFTEIMRQIERPKGMILTTGPTGSGKTTALYAFLRKIHTPDIKIITIEDPVEYHLAGIVQTQTNDEKKYTFLEGLRAALRQDPDVIMIGEIRDTETARTAVTAALTGHLVFSTLHTNTAAGTFPRLIDLGVDPKAIISAMNIAMAQRLVRMLCGQCKKETAIEGEDKRIIDQIITTLPPDEIPANTTKMWIPVGCPTCNNTGFKGRIGVYEAILNDEALEKALLATPSEREIKKATQGQGILDMRQDGIVKVLTGLTTVEELKHIVDLEGNY
jgi:type IV pilus assembly protein PilB